MSHSDDEASKRGMRQSQEPSPRQDKPQEEREKPDGGQADDEEEQPKRGDRPTRVRYEQDDDPPLSGGTSQILTR